LGPVFFCASSARKDALLASKDSIAIDAAVAGTTHALVDLAECVWSIPLSALKCAHLQSIDRCNRRSCRTLQRGCDLRRPMIGTSRAPTAIAFVAQQAFTTIL